MSDSLPNPGDVCWKWNGDEFRAEKVTKSDWGVRFHPTERDCLVSVRDRINKMIGELDAQEENDRDT